MGRISFTVDAPLDASASAAWAELVDWHGHGAWIPATTVRILEGDGGVGTRFVARSGLGPVGFDDHMTVTELDPVALRAVVAKTGPLLLGTAGFTVVGTNTGCVVRWFEDVTVAKVPQALVPLVQPIAEASFRGAFARLRSRLEG